jgi:flagellar M-ring protein FliF
MARGRLDGAQAVAMRYLVALAVPRLDPEQVAVIDSAVGVILKPGVEDPAADLAGAGEAREKALERNLVSLLEARVGVGNARVAVSLDIDRERETVNERIIDPESRTLVSRENSDTTESDVGSASGAVTVASNLPEGDAAAPASQSKSQRSEASETTTFDLSETRREREKIAGAVKRATIAVLINSAPGVPDPEAAEDAPTPPRTARAPEELEALKKLVMAAAGFDAARGDVVTIESLDFDEPASAGAEAAKAGLVDWLMTHLMQVLQLLIPAIVALVLALFVVKPLLTSKEAPVLTPIPPTQLATAPTPLEPPRQATPIEDARRAASEKKDASAAVLKSWLDDAGTAA